MDRDTGNWECSIKTEWGSLSQSQGEPVSDCSRQHSSHNSSPLTPLQIITTRMLSRWETGWSRTLAGTIWDYHVYSIEKKIVSQSILRLETVLIWGLREECSNDPCCVKLRYAVILKWADIVQSVQTYSHNIRPHTSGFVLLDRANLFHLNCGV